MWLYFSESRSCMSWQAGKCRSYMYCSVKCIWAFRNVRVRVTEYCIFCQKGMSAILTLSPGCTTMMNALTSGIGNMSFRLSLCLSMTTGVLIRTRESRCFALGLIPCVILSFSQLWYTPKLCLCLLNHEMQGILITDFSGTVLAQWLCWTLDYRSECRAIDPAPWAWFIMKFTFIVQVIPRLLEPYSCRIEPETSH